MMLLDKYKAMLDNDNLNTVARAVVIEIVKDLEMVLAENEAEDQYFEDVSNSL
ncbi:MAG: hypothetical protein ACRCYA_02975 [Cetobacterium sp.]|uniref:hypothetical protein n=1 Tax=Cetobacterium sp. TaxID=2071632 RepID=UPI003F36CA0D